MNVRKSLMLFGCIILGAVLVGIYSCFNPEDYVFFPKCPFLLLTGLECPGCGSQRAIHSILHGDFIMALRYNALLVVSIPFVLSLIASKTVKTKLPALHIYLHSPIIVWGYFIIVIAWWILRNMY